MTLTADIGIKHLYRSSGHNFVGRHGQPAGEHLMVECDELQCRAGRGIVGDRFFDFKPAYCGQITFFSNEVYEALCRELRVSDRASSVFRRNVITTGVDLNSLVNEEFSIQGVHFRGIEECRPCHWMDHAFAPGAETFLKHCGGLRAIILTDGRLRQGGA